MGYHILAGSYDDAGMAMLDFDGGKLTLKRRIRAVCPSYMLLNEGGSRLCTVEETRDGSVCGWVKSGDTFELDARFPTQGGMPCHLSRAGEILLCANYDTGSVARFRFGRDGRLASSLPLVCHGEGSHVDPERQESAHAHFSTMTPDGKYVAVCDLGMDSVLFCDTSSIEADTMVYVRVSAPAGYGPRHAAFLPGSDRWYVACELSSHVLVYAGYAGEAKKLQDIPLTQGIESYPAAIRLSPDNRHLIVTNRGEDTISVFDVLPDGSIAPDGKIALGCSWPRDAAFSPCGKYLAVACQMGGKLQIYSFEDRLRLDEMTLPQVSAVLWY